MRFSRRFAAAVIAGMVAGSLGLSGAEVGQPLIGFPSPNRALLENQPEEFYMYVNRDFGGERTTPWQGGQYGFVRGPRQVGGSVVMAAWHEGIDIKPVRRDPAGNPLDPIYATADGVVVHASDDSRASNYGKYVVIEHRIAGSPFYSLYAHLGSIGVAVGQRVKQGETIGVMGYTGQGLDRARAHLHFEFCFMLTPNFATSPATRAAAAKHGNYHGWNLVGTNPAALLVESAKAPGKFDLIAFLRAQDVAFRVAVPNSVHLNLLRTHPWLADRGVESPPPAWLLHFTRYGTPVRAEPLGKAVENPYVAWAADMPHGYARTTRNLLGGEAGRPVLGRSGRQLIENLFAPPGEPVQITGAE